MDFINDQPITPSSIIICTDSLSSIQALQNPKSNRKELLLEILFLIHQLIIKNVLVTITWIPSHCGICGNDEADRAAKKAAKSHVSPINLGLSVNECYHLLNNVVTKAWYKELDIYGRNHDWNGKPVKGGLFLPVPYHLSSLITRLRTDSYYCKFRKLYCNCDQVLNILHIFSGCTYINHEFSTFIDKLRQQGQTFTYETVLAQNDAGDWNTLITFAQEIAKSTIGHLF